MKTKLLSSLSLTEHLNIFRASRSVDRRTLCYSQTRSADLETLNLRNVRSGKALLGTYYVHEYNKLWRACQSLRSISRHECMSSSRQSPDNCSKQPAPDGSFHNFAASKSADKRFWTTYNSPIDGFWGSKIAKGPVGQFHWLHEGTMQL